MRSSESESVNPYQSPVSASGPQAVALPESDAEISLPAKFEEKNVVLRGYPDRLQILDDQGKAFELPRRPLFAKLVHGTFIRHSFRAKLDKTYVFKLSKDDFATLKKWIGRPTHADLRESVGAGSWWPLLVAALFIIPALPQRPSLSHFLSLVIGGFLIAQFVVARIKPNRFVFLLSTFAFALIATLSCLRIVDAFADDGTLSWFRMVIVLLVCNFCLWWIRQFIAYGEMEPRTE